MLLYVLDGHSCAVKVGEGEWRANHIDLEQDFPGQTNIDAVILNKNNKTAKTIIRRYHI